MTPEFSRPVALARIGSSPTESIVSAAPDECRALAHRMGLPAILSLDCRLVLTRDGVAVRAEGELRARVLQVCVVSLDEFESVVEDRFVVRFVPAGSEAEAIDPEAEDEIPYEGTEIDLGEAAAEQLALALDAYPRKPGVVLEAEPLQRPSPFAGLEALRRRH